MTRLDEQPGERIDRATKLTFTFDGKEVSAFAGDTIGSALYASGRRTFSRSFKYHRPRGLMCCAGQCPNCMVDVNGAPGIRACTEPVRPEMAVRHLNATPTLDFDLMRVTDLAGGAFTPVGFYYKTFIRPRRLWPLYEKLLRHAAGLGVLPKKAAGPHRKWRTEYRRRHSDVLVTGGGEAGLHAAITAAKQGADVLLADEGPEPGGRMLAEGRHAEASALAERARTAGVEILANAPVLGVFDGLAAIWQGSTLHQVRAPQHVFATGAIEQPIVFPGNDLPGVMLSGGVRRLISLYGVKPGQRAVVAIVGDHGLDAVNALQKAGVEVVAVADVRKGKRVVKAAGRKRLSRVTVSHDDTKTRREYDVDLLVVAGPMSPATSLVRQAGSHAGVHVAGDVSGELAASSGAAAGCAAARAEQRTPPDPLLVDAPDPEIGDGKSIVCFCEDVTVKDLEQTVAEGYESLELAKRYSTATMGPCQGRMCHLNATKVLAKETNLDQAAVGQTTARPPWSSVPLGALAGRPLEPAKRSALQDRHRALKGDIRWAGDWRRPYDYGDPEREVCAVQGAAGVIDVSTLGKLIVRGPESGELLDRLYPNVMSTLKPGRIRYGVLTTDAGRLMDDGTVARLDESTFYVTTTSSGAAGVEQWFTWWLAVWELDAEVIDVSQGLAAMNLAGPRAREVLTGLTDLDVSNESLGYLDARSGEIAGVQSLVLRIGFVGELGYEIHCSGPQASHIWDSITAAGVEPFGLEAQRILRLQKQHVIIGQDTDQESTPYGARMPWIVKLEKPQDFIGRWALEHASQETPATSLIGFRCAGDAVPTEGAVVLDKHGTAAGQVTSARRSPVLGCVIGLAWLPAELALDGVEFQISDGERTLPAVAATEPFYDPEGTALRS